MIDPTKIFITASEAATPVFAKVQGAAERLHSSYARLAGLMSTAIGVGSFAVLMKGAIDAADELNKLSQKTGVAVADLSALKYAADLSGVSSESLGKGLKSLNENLVKAHDATSKQAQLFRALGVDVTQGPSKAIDQLAGAFASLQDGEVKTTLATQLFGKAGMDMIPMLNQGAEGLRKMKEEAQRLGLVMTDETAKAAEQFNDNMRAVKAAAEGAAQVMFTEAAPSFLRVSEAMKEAAIEGGILHAVWIGMGGALSEILGLNAEGERRIRQINAELARLNAEIRSGEKAGVIVQQALIDQRRPRIKQLEDELRILKEQKAVEDAMRQFRNVQGGRSSTADKTDALRGILGGGSEAAEREAKRLRDEDIRGWVAYIETQTDEYERGLKDMAKETDKFWKEKKRLQDLDDKGWVEKIDADIEEYENGLKEVARLQPSFMESWKQQWDQWSSLIGDFFADLVMNGKSAFDNLKRFVKQLLAEMIALFARRWVLQLAGVSGGASVGGNSFAGGLMDAGTSAIGNWAGSALGLTGATGAASMFMGGMTGAIPAAAIGANAVAAGVGVNSTAAALGSSLSGVYSALAAIPVWGWIAMAVIAIGAWIAGNAKGGPKVGGSFFSGGAVPGTDNGRFFTPDQGDSMMQQMVEATTQGYTDAITRLGGQAGAFNFGLGFDHDPNGSARSRVSSMVTDASGRVLYSAMDREMDDKEVEAALGLEAQRMLLVALQNSDLPAAVSEALNAVAAETATPEQIQAAIAAAQEIAGIIDVLAVWNVEGLNIETLQAMVREGETLGQTFQSLAQAMATYYQLFYTEDENLARNTEMLRKQFEAMGLEMPATREAFRAMVESLLAMGEEGAATARWLLEISGAMNEVLPPLEGFNEQIEEVGETVTVATQLFTAAIGQIVSGVNDPLTLWHQGGPARRGIGDYLSGLLSGDSSPLDPMGRFGAAQQNYQSVLGLAQGGDIDAMMKLPSVHKTMIDIARSIWGSSSAFVSLFERSFNEVAAVGEVPDYQARMLAIQTDTAQYAAQSADSLVSIRDILIEIRDRSPATADSWSDR